MPIALKKLTDQEHQVSVTVQIAEDGQLKEEVLNVKFRPITPKLLRKANALNGSSGTAQKLDAEKVISSEAEEKSGLVKELALLVIDIDAVDEQGNCIKPTEDVLDEIDLKVLRVIDRAIWDYTFPNVAT